jgi:hypothetical protein
VLVTGRRHCLQRRRGPAGRWLRACCRAYFWLQEMLLCNRCGEKREEEIGVWKGDCEIVEKYSKVKAFGQEYILGPIYVL